jgi:hypothetical protein
MLFAIMTSRDHTSYCHLHTPRRPLRILPEWMPIRISRVSFSFLSSLQIQKNGVKAIWKHHKSQQMLYVNCMSNTPVTDEIPMQHSCLTKQKTPSSFQFQINRNCNIASTVKTICQERTTLTILSSRLWVAATNFSLCENNY